MAALSEQIVLWRDADQTIRAVEDRCPHRGARLSLGVNKGTTIACWYHGVEVDSAGTVASVPAMKTCALEGKKCLKSYPAREVAGAVFLWFGDLSDGEPPALELPEELTSPKFSRFLCLQNWACNYRYAIDNVMDPMHGTYLHGMSHSMAEGDRQAELTIRETPTGFVCEKVGQKGINFDWVEYGETSAAWMRLAVPYKKRYGGGMFIIVGLVTPVDATHCQVYFWRIREAEGFDRDVWRFLYRTRLEGLHWDVLEQDRQVIESLSRDARQKEHLYQHDIGITRIRRRMEQHAMQRHRD